MTTTEVALSSEWQSWAPNHNEEMGMDAKDKLGFPNSTLKCEASVEVTASPSLAVSLCCGGIWQETCH